MNQVRAQPLLAIVALGLLITLLTWSLSQREIPLRLATHSWPGYDLLYLSIEQGRYDPSALRIHSNESAAASMAALRDGAVDVATLTLDEALQLRTEGVNLNVVHLIDISNGADAVMAKEPLVPGPQLRNKRIVVEAQLVGGLLLDALLDASGLQRTDVEIITVDDVSIAHWRDEVDLLIGYEPLLTELERRGAHRIFDSRDIPYTIIDVLVASEQALADHARGIRKLVGAYITGREIWNQNPMDSKFRLAATLGMLPEDIESILGGLLLPEPEYTRALLSQPNGELSAVCQTVQRRRNSTPSVCSDLFRADYLPVLSQ